MLEGERCARSVEIDMSFLIVDVVAFLEIFH